MSTVGDTVDRLEQLLVQAIDGSSIAPRYEQRIDPERYPLPTWIILPQGGIPERIAARNFNTTRDYIAMVLLELVPDDQPQLQQEARERGWEYLDTVPQFLAAHPYLEDHSDTTPDAGFAVSFTLPREDAVQLTTWGGDLFTAIPFRFSVTTSAEV